MRRTIIVQVFTLYGYGYARKYEVMYEDSKRMYCKRIEYINDFNEVKEIVENNSMDLSRANLSFDDTWLKIFDK
jgi:hypothetical protein